jgi:hypothetical protein
MVSSIFEIGVEKITISASSTAFILSLVKIKLFSLATLLPLSTFLQVIITSSLEKFDFINLANQSQNPLVAQITAIFIVVVLFI